MQHVSPICIIKVSDNDNANQCEYDCVSWFHALYVGLLDSQYQKYAKDSSKLWKCNRADCLAKRNDVLSILLTCQMNNL